MRHALIAIVVLISAAASAAGQAQTHAADALSVSHPAAAQQSAAPAAPPTELQKKIQAYLREVYGFGPDFTITVGVPQPSPIGDLDTINVTVSFNGQTDSTVVFATKDGKFLVRGELDDMSLDPLASVRSALHVEGAPSEGPTEARVTLVEFADYECPVCHQLDTLLRTLLPKYPTARLIFKDFPLTDIHPWALSAAEAGHCAFIQNSAAFWKFHDSIFDSQDLISPDNAYDKLLDLSAQAGLNPDQLKSCMADPKTADFIKSEQAEGQALQVDSTPTVFVNGRRVVGANQQLIEQYIQYELGKKPAAPKAP